MPFNTHWMNIPADYQEYAGFVYKIKNKINNRAYIGRKYFYKKLGRALVESDWRTYISSSAELKADIKKYGKENFEFYCLSVGKDKVEVNYLEVMIQINANVLYEKLPTGELAYYNKNIMSRYFQPKEAGTQEYKEKCRNISIALRRLHANGYVHPMQGKQHPNKGKKLPQTAPKTSRQATMWYTDGSINVAIKKGDEIPEGFKRGLSMRKRKVSSVRKLYEENPKICLLCGGKIIFKKRGNKFCSDACQNKHLSDLSKERYAKGELAINSLNDGTNPKVKEIRENNSEQLKAKYASGEFIHPLLGKVHSSKGKKRTPKVTV